MEKKEIGKTGLKASPIGLGTWGISGVWFEPDGVTPHSWGPSEEKDCVEAVRTAVEHGINLFDTASVYGCGRSERILGTALKNVRNEMVIASRFGYEFDEQNLKAIGISHNPSVIRKSLEDSLRRLQTDYIDIYTFIDWGCPVDKAEPIRELLETFIDEGKIRTYGWSTDLKDRIESFLPGKNFSTAHVMYNVFTGNSDLVELAEENNLTLLCRSPLAMGLLTDSYGEDDRISGQDVRATKADWFRWFQEGIPCKEDIQRRESVREILTSGGRTLAQGALAYLMGKSPTMIPTPGFRNTVQVKENAAAIEKGPLSPDQINEVEKLVGFIKI